VAKKNIIIKMGLPDWVMTYGDMMSLLLTFFVLIVSFSSMQETKFQQAANSLKDAFGVLATPESVIKFDEPLVPNHNPDSEEADVLYEVRSVEKMILDEGLDKQVAVEVREDGVLFRLDAPFLFRSGGAELAEEPKGVLAEMGRFFTKFPYQVEVEGHTDDIPINSARFPSNWELSAARAVTVARYFQSLGMPPGRLAATGYGEFHPLAENATPEGREKNRRVEVFLHLDRNDLAAQKDLPFAEAPVRIEPVEEQTGPAATEIDPVRPIINPVTGKLGPLPLNR
jgi:chemotaxis protein MotB